MQIGHRSLVPLFVIISFVSPFSHLGQETDDKSKVGAPKNTAPKNTGPKNAAPKGAVTKPGDKEPTGNAPAASADDPRESEPAESDDQDSFTLEPGSRRQTDAHWKKKTPGLAFKVMRQHGTETKFSGKYTRSKAKGIYRCAGCGAILFSSDQKFDSKTGWPSFWAPLAPKNIGQSIDNKLPGETRIEIHCVACDAHLGHVFRDGPQPTGLRYCLNSVALKIDESDKAKKLMKDGPDASDNKKASSGEKQQ
jgi:peptide-methionine (R)-S-oxide reductase